LSVVLAALAFVVAVLSFASSGCDAKRARRSAERAEERLFRLDGEESEATCRRVWLRYVVTADDWPIDNRMWVKLGASNVGPAVARDDQEASLANR
jgi:hypothetical protein